MKSAMTEHFNVVNIGVYVVRHTNPLVSSMYTACKASI